MQAKQYRKKPVIISAVKVWKNMGGLDNDWNHPGTRGDMPQWLIDAYENKEKGKGILFLPDGVEIITLEGIMKADIGDYIIKGVQGELYPCKPDIFAATYEEVEDGPELAE